RRSRFNGATASQPWKRFYVDDDEVWTLALQWSHGFSAVETSATSRSRSRSSRLQWSHGFSAVETSPCGRLRGGGQGLQWSHGFSAVETDAETAKAIAAQLLQWSHGFSAVETWRRSRSRRSASRFNGATASQPWKPVRRGDVVAHDRASMEPRLLSR